jgi:hypothetical protein
MTIIVEWESKVPLVRVIGIGTNSFSAIFSRDLEFAVFIHL